MSINISIPKSPELKPRIVVIGVGGAGGNAVNNMIDSGLGGVEFLVANTDAQALALSKADRRIQMGGAITQGLGAGMRPEVGEEAAESSLDEIMEHLDGTHMLFGAAGMGGGTGTGAAPVIARAARDRGILTVAIVTKPFQFEGSRRMALAESGIEALYNSVDTLIVIPNQNLFRVATESTTMADAFAMADEVLNSGVRGVTDLMVVPGLINLDFADVRTVMDEMGKAMMGTGEATGERRAIEAAESAIANPLLDDVSLKGARALLINITGGADMTLFEVDEAANRVREEVDPEANIIFGSTFSEESEGKIRVSVVATGIDAQTQANTSQQKMMHGSSEPKKPFTFSSAPKLGPVKQAAPASRTVSFEAPRAQTMAEQAPIQPVRPAQVSASSASPSMQHYSTPLADEMKNEVRSAPQPQAEYSPPATTHVAQQNMPEFKPTEREAASAPDLFERPRMMPEAVSPRNEMYEIE
ncbi:MAG: cell division protein FtsZ, partial [Robiginitomaculum sp.]|nr:cell division protein FtsZ [Robiginitomaculum sp.]